MAVTFKTVQLRRGAQRPFAATDSSPDQTIGLVCTNTDEVERLHSPLTLAVSGHQGSELGHTSIDLLLMWRLLKIINMPRGPPTPIAVTVADARRITGLGNTTIYELIKQGRLKTVAIGRRRLVLYSSIEALLQPTTD